MLLALIVCQSSLLIFLWSGEVHGAGRAFPVDSENYATERFQALNSRLEWDSSNFLVDLSGHYATCDVAGSGVQDLNVEKLTPEGDSISGLVDSTNGAGADVDSVNGYIRVVIDRWINQGRKNSLIRGAQKFGCSVRPACGRPGDKSAVVSCLFSPGNSDDGFQGDRPSDLFEIEAKAFTPEQYEVAEKYTGNKWDPSHFLENLSGRETRCGMVTDNNWPFANLRKIEAEYGLRISPVYGSALNRGNTQDAIEEILSTFKQIRNANELGCSLIPDCIVGQQMHVVVSCLYLTE